MVFVTHSSDLSCGDTDAEIRHQIYESDNIDSLGYLLSDYEGKVDLIYIDPPYNTGSKLTYSDKTSGKVYQEIHESWREFMTPRLELAHKLLADDGFIFVSIGSEEMPYLGVILNDVFGEQNLVSVCTRYLGWSPRVTKGTNNLTDYVYVYAKDKTKGALNRIPAITDFNGTHVDEKFLERGAYKLYALARGSLKWSEAMAREVTLDGVTYYPCSAKDTPNRTEGWTWVRGIERIKKEWDEGLIVADKKGLLYYKVYEYDENGEGRKRSLPNLWTPEMLPGYRMSSRDGHKDIENILGKGTFTFPKPVDMLKLILEVATDKNSLVLDFFAGSGTTGQAVMEANRADGGSRRFILCTNNENNIARNVTQKRLERVLTGRNWADRKTHPVMENQRIEYYLVEKTGENTSTSDTIEPKQ